MGTNTSVSLHVGLSKLQYILAVRILTNYFFLFYVAYAMVKSQMTFFLKIGLFLVSI